MIKTILTLAFAASTGAAGWLGGSVFPAPPEWTDGINRQAGDLRARLRIESMDLASLRRLAPNAKFKEFGDEFKSMAAAAGEVIEVDTANSSLDEQLDNLAMTEAEAASLTAAPVSITPPGPMPVSAAGPVSAAAPAAARPGASIPAPSATRPALPPAVGASVFEAALALCPRMTIENAPAADAKLQVAAFKPFVDVQGVKLATNPALGSCLSSGFGARASRLHKGVDYQNESGGLILAGADGTIVELKYRDDYGNMIVIDHGKGVYTRYAHLASFGRGLTSGVTVKAGEQIGLMGNTAAYRLPIHLHYELLLGDYATPKGSFGLTPKNPFDYPAAG